MERQNTILRTLSTTLVLATLVSACGGSGKNDGPTKADQSTGLVIAQTDEALLDSFQSYYTTSQKQYQEWLQRAQTATTGSIFPDAIDSSAAQADNSASEDFSSTYLIENGLDEHDKVKYNGTHLFIATDASGNWFNCCDLFLGVNEAIPSAITDTTGEDTATTIEENEAIRILETDSVNASATQVGSIYLDPSLKVQGMFLNNEGLTVIANEHELISCGVGWANAPIWQRKNFKILHYSITTPESPQLEWDLEIDGRLVEARVKDGLLYLGSRHAPIIDDVNYYTSNQEEVTTSLAILADLKSSDILPTYSLNGDESQALINSQNTYILGPNAHDEESARYINFTSITAIPLNDPSQLNSVAYNASASGMYFSASSVYLAKERQAYTEDAKTSIHKFSLNDNDIRYQGSTIVKGQLFNGSSAGFKINEHQGNLRLVTQLFKNDATDRVDNYLHTLRESASETTLEHISTLPNDDRPAEIGKPNESVFGVRFFGDKAYLVTFERTDPLYVIDLSIPEDPILAGSLEIPGVSELLHPVNDALLLGFGREGTQLKLELFNVEDITEPKTISTILFSSPYSEALFNHHAFTYLSGEHLDRIAIPSITYQAEGSETALHMFELENKNQQADSAYISKVGALTSNDLNTYSGTSRSVLHDDAVFFVVGDTLWSGTWGSDETTGPQ